MSHSASRACDPVLARRPARLRLRRGEGELLGRPGARRAGARPRGRAAPRTRRAAASAFAASPGLLSRTRSPPIVHRNAPGARGQEAAAGQAAV